MGLWLTTACTGPSPGGCADDADACVPAEAPAEGPPRTWASDEAVSHLAEALGHGIPDPTGLAEAYTRALLGGDSECPRFLDASGAVWAAECTAASGWSYSGTSLYTDERTETARSLRMTASFTVTDAEGDPFRGGGEVLYESASAAGATEWSGQVGGVFAWSGEAGWLGEARGEALFLEGASDGTSRSLRLDGGVEYASATISFSGLSVDTATCAGDAPVDAPATLQVRDPGGAWFTLDLPGDCTGCGELWFGAEALGPACVPLAGLLEIPMAEAE